MRKIVLFPYHPDIHIILKHLDALKECELIGVVSYKEDSLLIQELYEKLEIDYLTYEEMLIECDEIVLLENYRGYKVDKYYKIMNDAIAREKTIYVTQPLLKQLNLADYYGCYKLLEKTCDYDESFDFDYWRNRQLNNESILFDIVTPVVAVMGMGKHCSKFEVLLQLKKVLEKDYNIVTISSNSLGALLGCYSLPRFLFEEISFESKILRFNHFMKRVIDDQQPNAVLIEIPEGTGPFIKAETNHFAEYPLVITSAIPVDMAVFCTYFLSEGVTCESLKMVADQIQKRFGVPVLGVSISRTMFEVSTEERGIIYEHLDDAYILNNYPDLCLSEPVSFISLRNNEESIMSIYECIKKLENNVDVV